MEEKLNDVSNFVTGTYRQYCAGLIGATVSLNGPYDIGPSGSGGNMALVVGTTYSLTLNVTDTLSITVSAICNKIDLSTDIDGFAQAKVSMTVNGSYTSQIA